MRISIINGWLALGCTLELILDAIARRAVKRDPAPTKSLKRFDSTIRGMRRDQLGGELPVTSDDVDALTNGRGEAIGSKRVSVMGREAWEDDRRQGSANTTAAPSGDHQGTAREPLRRSAWRLWARPGRRPLG
jgi:hypothetical protein